MLRPQEKKKEKGSQEGKKTASDVCKLYNLKVCKSQADKECKATWGRTLRLLQQVSSRRKSLSKGPHSPGPCLVPIVVLVLI